MFQTKSHVPGFSWNKILISAVQEKFYVKNKRKRDYILPSHSSIFSNFLYKYFKCFTNTYLNFNQKNFRHQTWHIFLWRQSIGAMFMFYSEMTSIFSVEYQAVKVTPTAVSERVRHLLPYPLGGTLFRNLIVGPRTAAFITKLVQ